MNNKLDERRHYRFPMFDDDTPVKQIDEVVRVVLQEEFPMPLPSEDVTYTSERLTNAADDALAGDDHGSLFSDYELEKNLEVNYDSELVSKEETLDSDEPDMTLEKPVFSSDYQPIIQSRQSRMTRKQHQPEHKKTWNRGKKQPEEADTYETETSLTKHFIPTYIPESRNRSYASLKKEEENKQLILERFHKERSSYLLIDPDDTQEEAGDGTKVVIKDAPLFKRDTTDIPFTRRQFKQLSDEEKEEVSLPSEVELKTKLGGKPNRLERGLKGILADESGKQGATRYFE